MKTIPQNLQIAQLFGGATGGPNICEVRKSRWFGGPPNNCEGGVIAIAIYAPPGPSADARPPGP